MRPQAVTIVKNIYYIVHITVSSGLVSLLSRDLSWTWNLFGLKQLWLLNMWKWCISFLAAGDEGCVLKYSIVDEMHKNKLWSNCIVLHVCFLWLHMNWLSGSEGLLLSSSYVYWTIKYTCILRKWKIFLCSFCKLSGSVLLWMQAVPLHMVLDGLVPMTHLSRVEKPCSLWLVNNLLLVHFYVSTEMFWPLTGGLHMLPAFVPDE